MQVISCNIARAVCGDSKAAMGIFHDAPGRLRWAETTYLPLSAGNGGVDRYPVGSDYYTSAYGSSTEPTVTVKKPHHSASILVL
jgi:hypothetical protein